MRHADALGKKVFQEACASCHDWTGVSVISPYATIAGARAVNDPKATNVAQIVISGTRRIAPKGIISMPAFGAAYSDYGDRRRRQLRHRALWQRAVADHRQKGSGVAQRDRALRSRRGRRAEWTAGVPLEAHFGKASSLELSLCIIYGNKID